MSRCSTVRGSRSGLSMGGPTKVKAFKSFLFTDGSLKVGSIKPVLWNWQGGDIKTVLCPIKVNSNLPYPHLVIASRLTRCYIEGGQEEMSPVTGSHL